MNEKYRERNGKYVLLYLKQEFGYNVCCVNVSMRFLSTFDYVGFIDIFIFHQTCFINALNI